jgi:hypothetical protein
MYQNNIKSTEQNQHDKDTNGCGCGCGGGGCGTGRCFYRTTIIIYRCKIMSFYDTNFPYNVSKS